MRLTRLVKNGTIETTAIFCIFYILLIYKCRSFVTHFTHKHFTATLDANLKVVQLCLAGLQNCNYILQPRPRENKRKLLQPTPTTGDPSSWPWTDASPQIRNLWTLYLDISREREGSIPYIRTVLRCAVPIQYPTKGGVFLKFLPAEKKPR